MKGVSFDKRYNRFIARIYFDGKSKQIGTYRTHWDAQAAYEAERAKHPDKRTKLAA